MVKAGISKKVVHEQRLRGEEVRARRCLGNAFKAEGRVMQRPGGIVVRKGQRACILLGPEGIFVRIQEADFGENEAQGQPRMALKPS